MSNNTTSKYASSKKDLCSFEDLFFNSTQTQVHATSIIGPNVQLGQNVKIGPFCTIIGNITIGSNTKIFSNVTIGFPAQDVRVENFLGTISIGENCIIREFSTINCSKKEGGITKIGNKCYLMNYCHVSHDTILEDNVTLTNNVNLGGHSYIENNVMLMANTAVHQFCKIGKFSCVTPYSGSRQDLPPFSMFTGQPCHFSGLNRIALKRANMTSETINAIKHVAKLYYQDKLPLEKIMAFASAEEWGKNQQAQEFLTFIENSKRGVSRRAIANVGNAYYKGDTK